MQSKHLFVKPFKENNKLKKQGQTYLHISRETTH